jgi:hypothetical protein
MTIQEIVADLERATDRLKYYTDEINRQELLESYAQLIKDLSECPSGLYDESDLEEATEIGQNQGFNNAIKQVREKCTHYLELPDDEIDGGQKYWIKTISKEVRDMEYAE